MATASRPRPAQERSRRTERALLESALGLFRERGVDAVKMQDVAAVAGVSPATINRRFGDKDGLVREAFRAFIERSLAMLAAASPAAEKRRGGIVELAAEITAAVMRYSQENQGILQSAYARALVDEEFAAGLRELRIRTLALLRGRFGAHVAEIGHPEPSLAIEFALAQAVAMLSARHEAARLEVGAMDDRVFVRELMRSLLAYLEVPFTPRAVEKALSARGL